MARRSKRVPAAKRNADRLERAEERLEEAIRTYLDDPAESDPAQEAKLTAARVEAYAAGLGQEQVKAVFERCVA